MKGLSVLDDDFRHQNTPICNGHRSSNGLHKKSSNEMTFKKLCTLEAAKYPFLTQAQIKQRVAETFKKRHFSNDKFQNSKSDSDLSGHSPKRKRSPQPTKRPLVPLNVSFVPITRSGGLKRSPATNSEKRHVTFNKELYIRYRTTSESSNSTLKERKKCYKKNSRRLTPIKNEQSFDNHTTLMELDQESSMEKKFEQLLNEKCSWSYRSQKVIKNGQENSSLELERTIMTVKVEDNSFDSHNENGSENLDLYSWFNENPQKTKSAQKTRTKAVKKRAPQRKGKNARIPIPKRKANAGATSKIPNSKRKVGNQRIRNQKETSISSSDEEVLQTRYSVKNSKFVTENQDDGSIVLENKVKEKDADEIEASKDKTPTVIRQASEFYKNGANKNLALQNVNNLDHTMIDGNDVDELDNGSVDVLVSETSTPEFSKESLFEKTNGENMAPVSENVEKEDKSSQSVSDGLFNDEFPNENNNVCIYPEDDLSDNQVMSEFLNGSLDLEVYKNTNKYLEKSFASKTKKYVENDMPKLKDCEYFFKTDEYHNRELDNTDDENEEKEKDKSSEKPIIQYLTLSAQKNKQKKSTMPKRVSKRNACKTKKTIQTPQPEKAFKNAKNSVENLNSLIHVKPIECINIKSSDDTAENTVKKVKKHKRCSSLEATRKIRAIGKFENSAPSSDSEVLYLGKEIASSALLRSIKQRMNRIVKSEGNRISPNQRNIENNGCGPSIESKYNLKNGLEKNQGLMRKTRQKKVKQVKPFKNSNKGKLGSDKNKVSSSRGRKPKKTNQEITEPMDLQNENFLKFEDDVFQTQKFTNELERKEANSACYGKQPRKTFTEICTYQNNGEVSMKIDKRHKTWSDLEQELLNELDYDIKPADRKNVSKTVVLQHERLVQKKQNSTKKNIFEVSSTSMTQTISKGAPGDKIRMQCEKRGYMTSTPFRHKYQDWKKDKSPLSKEIMLFNPQESPLEKAIAAMDKCTAGILKPSQKVLLNNTFTIENVGLDSNERRRLSFSASEESDSQSQSVKQIEYPEGLLDDFKSNTLKMNVTRTYKNVNLMKNKHGSGSSHAVEVSSPAYNFQSLKSKQEETKDYRTLFPSQVMNPWDKLNRRLELEENEEKVDESVLNLKKQSCYKKLETEWDKDNEGEANIEKIAGGNVQSDDDCSVLDQEINENGPMNEKIIETVEISKVTDNSLPIHQELYKSENNSKLNKRSIDEFATEDKPRKKRKPLAKRKSPTFRFKAKRDGSLQLQSAKDSTSGSSDEFQRETEATAADARRSKAVKTHKTAREKYCKYIKNVSLAQLKASNEKDATASQNHLNFKNLDVAGKNKTLIAENDSDVFSISSSDSEHMEEQKGSGILCELFDD